MDKFIKYLSETAAELNQVSWPTQHQAMLYTVLVIGISIIVSMFVGAFDYLFSQFINFIVNKI
jgi:preprotein translocase subunit SecE